VYVNTERDYYRLIYLSGKNKTCINGCSTAVTFDRKLKKKIKQNFFCETEKSAIENFSLLLCVYGKDALSGAHVFGARGLQKKERMYKTTNDVAFRQ
jgi:hypothetical protein